MKHKKKKLTQQQKYFPPVLTYLDRVFMAYHEAGHAICSHYLPEREELLCVSIDPSNEAFGMIKTKLRPHHNETEISFSSTIATLLAGRLAEEMFLYCKTTSCIYDLSSARKIASDMVLKFGMGERSGLTALSSDEISQISNSQRELVEHDIRKILKDAEIKAREILQKNHVLVERMATALLLKKTLMEDEIIDFFTEDDK